jgi:hypothetical protein
MSTDVVFDHLGHQTCDAAANARNHMHDALAFGLLGQRTLDRFDLAANPTHPGEQLLFLSDRVCHEA